MGLTQGACPRLWRQCRPMAACFILWWILGCLEEGADYAVKVLPKAFLAKDSPHSKNLVNEMAILQVSWCVKGICW